MIMIEVRQLVHRYANADPAQPDALAGVSLQVSPGEYLAVLGRNGCGKSTLAKHLNALLLPTEGEVLVDGLNTKDPDLTLAIRQKVGMVFQNPDNQLVATTVMEDVAFGPENLGLPREEILKRIDEALARVRMTDFKEAEPHHLSGGQKQRVAIAGVLAMEPDYIVFDEPTAMLDPRGREEILATMLELKAAGIGVVNITHYMEEAVPADRVLVMTGGEIVLEGRPREIFSQVETLKDLHLDVPVVTELAQLLHDDCPWLARDILTPEEMVEALCP
ncbi:energy-coupling factor transporter ATPase [Peptococcus simiae]